MIQGRDLGPGAVAPPTLPVAPPLHISIHDIDFFFLIAFCYMPEFSHINMRWIFPDTHTMYLFDPNTTKTCAKAFLHIRISL